MEITYANQTISLDPSKEIILSLSGGLDSSSLAYLILKHFPETVIWPSCGKDVNSPFDSLKAQEIVDILREEFPKNKMMDLHIYTFDDRDPELQAKALPLLRNNTHNLDPSNIMGASKAMQVEDANREFMKIHPGIPIYDGLTQNPPIKDQKEFGMYDKAHRSRDPGMPRPPSMMTRPYINVDKKFVAAVYFENDLMEKLFPFTGSCVGTKYETKGFSEPCKECFWCKEKYWAFGEY